MHLADNPDMPTHARIARKIAGKKDKHSPFDLPALKLPRVFKESTDAPESSVLQPTVRSPQLFIQLLRCYPVACSIATNMSRVDVLNLSRASKATSDVLWARINPEKPVEDRLPERPGLILNFMLFEGVVDLISKLVVKIHGLNEMGLAAKETCSSWRQVLGYEKEAAREIKIISSYLDGIKAYRNSIEEDEDGTKNLAMLKKMGWDNLIPKYKQDKNYYQHQATSQFIVRDPAQHEGTDKGTPRKRTNSCPPRLQRERFNEFPVYRPNFRLRALNPPDPNNILSEKMRAEVILTKPMFERLSYMRDNLAMCRLHCLLEELRGENATEKADVFMLDGVSPGNNFFDTQDIFDVYGKCVCIKEMMISPLRCNYPATFLAEGHSRIHGVWKRHWYEGEEVAQLQHTLLRTDAGDVGIEEIRRLIDAKQQWGGWTYEEKTRITNIIDARFQRIYHWTIVPSPTDDREGESEWYWQTVVAKCIECASCHKNSEQLRDYHDDLYYSALKHRMTTGRQYMCDWIYGGIKFAEERIGTMECWGCKENHCMTCMVTAFISFPGVFMPPGMLPPWLFPYPSMAGRMRSIYRRACYSFIPALTAKFTGRPENSRTPYGTFTVICAKCWVNYLGPSETRLKDPPKMEMVIRNLYSPGAEKATLDTSKLRTNWACTWGQNKFVEVDKEDKGREVNISEDSGYKVQKMTLLQTRSWRLNTPTNNPWSALAIYIGGLV